MPRRKKTIIPQGQSYRALLYGVITVVVIFVLAFFLMKAISQRVGNIGESGIQTQNTNPNTYVVQTGDSLWSIAEAKYNDGHMWAEIAKANKLTSPDDIETGMKLKLPLAAVNPQSPPLTVTATVTTSPASPTKVPLTLTATPSPTRAPSSPTVVATKIPLTLTATPTPTPTQSGPTKAPAGQAAPGKKGAPTPVQSGQMGKITANTYTVLVGDNLWSIAVRAYGDGYKWTEIANANNLKNPNIIHPGNVFKLPR